MPGGRIYQLRGKNDDVGGDLESVFVCWAGFVSPAIEDIEGSYASTMPLEMAIARAIESSEEIDHEPALSYASHHK